ncbi:MAG: hypothetical protein ACHQ1F_05710 [Spirochaetia bacterium]
MPAQRDVEEQETLQSGRVTSALLSTLMGTEGRFFSAPSQRALTALGQFPTQHPNIALLETAQYGRETSALLSSIMSPPALKPQGNAVSMNHPAALTRAEGIFGATRTGQPSIQNSRVAHDAYLMETQAQRDIEQQVIMGAELEHQWFA